MGITVPAELLLITVPVQVPLATTCALMSRRIPVPVSMAPLLNTLPWTRSSLFDFWLMPSSPAFVPSVSSACPGVFAGLIGTCSLLPPVPALPLQVTSMLVPSAWGTVRSGQVCPASLLNALLRTWLIAVFRAASEA